MICWQCGNNSEYSGCTDEICSDDINTKLEICNCQVCECFIKTRINTCFDCLKGRHRGKI